MISSETRNVNVFYHSYGSLVEMDCSVMLLVSFNGLFKFWQQISFSHSFGIGILFIRAKTFISRKVTRAM